MKYNLPRRKIAEAIDADVSTVQSFENEKHTPHSAMLFLLSKAFSLEPEAFVKEINDQMTYLTDRDSSEK